MTHFSKGTRACIGINLAYCEMFLTLAAVFRRFHLELFETTTDDVRMVKDMFMAAPKSDSMGVRIRIKGEREYSS